MNTSRQEEIIAALWCVCAILCFSAGYTGWGWAFAAKCSLDVAFAGAFAVVETLKNVGHPRPRSGRRNENGKSTN